MFRGMFEILVESQKTHRVAMQRLLYCNPIEIGAVSILDMK